MCEQCGKEMDARCIPNHMLRLHGIGSQVIKCTLCKLKFLPGKDLATHMRRAHTETQFDECIEMVKVGRLKIHKLQKHTAEHLKPHVCNICTPPKGFTRKRNMQDHIDAHNGVKSYSCGECSYKCSDHSNMVKHKKKCIKS